MRYIPIWLCIAFQDLGVATVLSDGTLVAKAICNNELKSIVYLIYCMSLVGGRIC